MTDQQLLELAAKAAGYEISKSPAGKLWVRFVVTSWDEWNPLEDDGDALRLAVKLRLDVMCHEIGAHVDNELSYSSEVSHNNPYAATRRAIVRAAAEIGKNMGEQV